EGDVDYFRGHLTNSAGALVSADVTWPEEETSWAFTLRMYSAGTFDVTGGPVPYSNGGWGIETESDTADPGPAVDLDGFAVVTCIATDGSAIAYQGSLGSAHGNVIIE